jgi:hypothetical protein
MGPPLHKTNYLYDRGFLKEIALEFELIPAGGRSRFANGIARPQPKFALS